MPDKCVLLNQNVQVWLRFIYEFNQNIKNRLHSLFFAGKLQKHKQNIFKTKVTYIYSCVEASISLSFAYLYMLKCPSTVSS